MFSNWLNNLQRRRLRGMQAQAEQLDRPTRQMLQDYLRSELPHEGDDESSSDNKGEDPYPDTVESLQEELERSQANLDQLLEKEAFVGTRLKAYQSKLRAWKERNVEANDQEHSQHEMKYSQLLEQIELSHQSMLKAIEVLQDKVELMELRQHELRIKSSECRAVLEAAQALEALDMQGQDLADGMNLQEETTEEGDEEQPSPLSDPVDPPKVASDGNANKELTIKPAPETKSSILDALNEKEIATDQDEPDVDTT